MALDISDKATNVKIFKFSDSTFHAKARLMHPPLLPSQHTLLVQFPTRAVTGSVIVCGRGAYFTIVE